MSTIAIVCKFAAIHTTVEMNLEAWADHFGVERHSDLFEERFKRVLTARRKFHAAWEQAIVNISKDQKLSLLQAEKVLGDALLKSRQRHYAHRQARGI